jgi:predicted metal-dependent enzyme (double-stranded beta helix superfamily)
VTAAADPIAPLRDFVIAMTELVSRETREEVLLAQARPLLGALLKDDTWLPDDFARPHPEHYQQYLLHADPLERFSVVSFVWGPGQRTPVHDHTVWGLIGMLRGAETGTAWGRRADGHFGAIGEPHRLDVGGIDVVSPAVGDIHQVVNAYDDRASISIHVYGANIGAVARHVFDAAGSPRGFVSGYSSTAVPNLWDRSAATRAALTGAA